MKFLLYNTGPFITVGATARYIAASTEAFSFDGNPAEISSNVNMYASLSIHSFLKVLCSLTKCLRRPFNVKIKYFHHSTVTFTGHTAEQKAKSQTINVLLKYRLNFLQQVHIRINLAMHYCFIQSLFLHIYYVLIFSFYPLSMLQFNYSYHSCIIVERIINLKR